MPTCTESFALPRRCGLAPAADAAAIEAGADVVNDVTAGSEPGMFELVAEHGAALVLMHMRGIPRTMQQNVSYLDVVAEGCGGVGDPAHRDRVAGESVQHQQAEVALGVKPGEGVVADDRLSPADRAERGDWVGCIAGALSVSEYTDGLRAAGFVDISLTATHAAAEGLDSMIIRAVKPVR